MAPKRAVSKPYPKRVPTQTEEVPRKQRTPAKRAREEPSTSTGRRVRFQTTTQSTDRAPQSESQPESSYSSRIPIKKGQVLKMPTTYFRTELQHSRFYRNFYERKVFIPKIIDFKFLNDYEFDIEELLDFQGWIQLFKSDERIYPDLTRQFYYLWDNTKFCTYVKGTEINFGSNNYPDQDEALRRIGNILQVPFDEERLPKDLTMDKIYNELTKSNKYHAGTKFLHYMDLSPRLRVIRLLIAHCILPKGGGRNQLNPQEAMILWKLVNKVKISLPRLFLEALASRKDNPRGVLPYGSWITKIFERVELDIDGEPFEVPKTTNAINKALLQRMKINLEQFRDDRIREKLGEPVREQEDNAQAEGEQAPEASPERPASPLSHGSHSPQGSVAPERVPPTSDQMAALQNLKNEILEAMGQQEDRMTSLVTGVLNAITDMHSRQDHMDRELRTIKYHLASGRHKKRPMPELDPYESGSVHKAASPDHDISIYSSAQNRPIKPILYPISQFQFTKSLKVDRFLIV